MTWVNNQLILQTLCAAAWTISGSIKSTAAGSSSVWRLALARVLLCWRIMCWRMVIISGAGKRLSSLLQQHCTFIQKKISSSSSGPTVTDLPPRCHGDLTVLSALSKLWWFIDLWLAQLGGKHEKCRSQWQTTSYIKKRWKERADRKKNAVRLKRPTLNAFTVRAVIVCVCVPFAMSAHWQHSPVLSLCVPWVGVT